MCHACIRDYSCILVPLPTFSTRKVSNGQE